MYAKMIKLLVALSLLSSVLSACGRSGGDDFTGFAQPGQIHQYDDSGLAK